MGIASAVVYFDYCRQYFRSDILEPADYFDVFFLDVADRNGAGGVSARQKSGICKSSQGFGGRKRADYLPAYSAQCRGYEVTFVPFILSEAIVALTALDFLGLGLSQDYPSLGDLVRQGKDNLQAPWIGITIFIVLSSLLTLLIFIGEGVRDAFDARKSK